MKRDKVYSLALLSSVLLILPGAFFKIMHFPLADALLTTGLILMLLFIFIAVINIINDRSKPASEKLFWFTGFIFLPVIAGIYYYIKEIKHS